jgi:hypothetical protein
MSTWPEITAAQARFIPIGARHGLRLRAGGCSWPERMGGGSAVRVEVASTEGHALLLHTVEVRRAAAWIQALGDALDVPEGHLPAPSSWHGTAELLFEHDRAVRELPTAVA